MKTLTSGASAEPFGAVGHLLTLALAVLVATRLGAIFGRLVAAVGAVLLAVTHLVHRDTRLLGGCVGTAVGPAVKHVLSADNHRGDGVVGAQVAVN